MPILTFRLNGTDISLAAPPTARLIDLLRDDLGLMAAKPACDIGRCGACMVLADGEPANACLILAFQLGGAEIVSPEGLDRFEETRILREALAEENAFQCGYCAPGMVTVLTALLRAVPNPSEAEIRAALEGNICRCTGYHSIIRGARAAADRIAASGHPRGG